MAKRIGQKRIGQKKEQGSEVRTAAHEEYVKSSENRATNFSGAQRPSSSKTGLSIRAPEAPGPPPKENDFAAKGRPSRSEKVATLPFRPSGPSQHFIDRAQLEEEIKRSRSLLDYDDNWDDEGSEAYEEETWSRAVEFLRRGEIRRYIVPSILPGPEGSFDVVWRQASARLYMNFPRHGDSTVFFGTDVGETIRGSFDASRHIHSGLLAWLKEKFVPIGR